MYLAKIYLLKLAATADDMKPDEPNNQHVDKALNVVKPAGFLAVKTTNRLCQNIVYVDATFHMWAVEQRWGPQKHNICTKVGHRKLLDE